VAAILLLRDGAASASEELIDARMAKAREICLIHQRIADIEEHEHIQLAILPSCRPTPLPFSTPSPARYLPRVRSIRTTLSPSNASDLPRARVTECSALPPRYSCRGGSTALVGDPERIGRAIRPLHEAAILRVDAVDGADPEPTAEPHREPAHVCA